MKYLYPGFLILILYIPNLIAQLPQQEIEIGVEEKLDTYLPLSLQFYSENGDTMALKELVDKPTVLSMVYYRCPGICSPLMDGIADVIDKSDLELGEDYRVLTISFDPREGIELAQRKKANYLNRMIKKEAAKEGWLFFTSDSTNSADLTRLTGFKYKRQGNDFIHTATLVVLSPDGKIVRYLNGTYFLPFEFKLSIVEASKGKSGPTLNKVLQYCYSYDPSGQTYVLNITRVAGILITFAAIIFLLILVLKPLFRKKLIKDRT